MRTHDELVRDSEPFPDKLIMELPPRGDRFVTWSQYAQRLLFHHGGYNWHVNIVLESGPQWVVAGALTLPSGDTYSAVGEDDTATSAESNAFKRACSKAGIGLHLYEDRDKGNPYWLHTRLLELSGDEVDGVVAALVDPIADVADKAAALDGDTEGQDSRPEPPNPIQYADDDPERPF